jgi:hypothetical protein
MGSAMLALVLALAMTQSSCPMTIGIGGDGTFFSARFNGWYKISPKTLEGDLHGGCYNDANPLQLTSVKLLLAPKAPKPKVDLVISILAKEGWSREKINVQTWSGYPQAPR